MSAPKEIIPAPTRRSLPVTLPGATEYSADPALNAPLSLIGRIRGLGYPYKRLRENVRVDHKWGPKRSQGDWALVMFEFTASGMVDIEPWYNQRYDNASFWKACGFATRPSYSLVHQRLAELEPYAAEFDQLAGHLISVAASKDPHVGAWLHVDGTECETHAAAHHDCRPGDDCPDRTLKQLQRLDTRAARRIRHKETLEPTDEEPPDDLAVDERGGKRFRSGDHWWYLRDASAGRRAYKRDGKVIRSWDGYSLITVTDHYTGAMLPGTSNPPTCKKSKDTNRPSNVSNAPSAAPQSPSAPIAASTTTRSLSPTLARASPASSPTDATATTNR